MNIGGKRLIAWRQNWNIFRAFSRKLGHACGMSKKRQKKPIKGAQFGISTPYFSKVRAFRILQPPKWHLVLKVLEDN